MDSINEHVGDVDLEIATSLLTLWSLSLFSQKAPKRSQRSSRWSKTAFIHSRVLAISWKTNAISDWDGDGSFSTKSWRCNIWSESLVKFPTDIISPDDSWLRNVCQMNRLNFQQIQFRHVKLNFQQKEIQQMPLLEPIQHNSQSLLSCATAL